MKKISDELSGRDSPDYIRNMILRRLKIAGLEYYLVLSAQKDEVYIKVRAPLIRLLREADRVDFYLPINAKEAEQRLKQGTPFWKSIHYAEEYRGTSLKPFEHIHANFDMDPKFRNLFTNSKLAAFLEREGLSHLTSANAPKEQQAVGDVLSEANRMTLIYSILCARVFNGGCHLDLPKFKKNGAILGYYCVHHNSKLDELEDEWLFAVPWLTPVEAIRNYFGERIGLYFAFQSHYTSWLIFAAAVGCLFWIGVALYNNDPSAPDMPYYGGIMALWATFMLEFWKRKEVRYSLRWGTSKFEEKETDRPGHDGEIVKSPVDTENMIYFSR